MVRGAAPRGEMIDIGGRRLRCVREGPPASPAPLIVCEHGAVGCAADWAEVQARLAVLGLRSLAYDRAGLGFSEPGPTPRDGRAAATDLDLLLNALNETGPLILMGHSMGGLMVRIFAFDHPTRVRGVVLVDAVVPEVMGVAAGARGVRAFGRLLIGVRALSKLGLMRAASLMTGNMIGLTGEAAREKRCIYGLPGHAHWAAEEVLNWPRASAQAGASTFPDHWPLAVVTAGAAKPANLRLKAMQAAPGHAARHGLVDHVARANHSTLLGRRFADRIVAGVSHVLAAGAQSGSRAT